MWSQQNCSLPLLLPQEPLPGSGDNRLVLPEGLVQGCPQPDAGVARGRGGERGTPPQGYCHVYVDAAFPQRDLLVFPREPETAISCF